MKTNLATEIAWQRRAQDDRSGFYCLRSDCLDFKEQALFVIFSMLTDIEDAFRSMKSELGLCPVYHQKERRGDGHLFITVLAYHVLHTIRFKLGKRGMTQSWSAIRKGLSTHPHAHHHHHEKRRRQNDPHSQIDPAGTFPRSDL